MPTPSDPRTNVPEDPALERLRTRTDELELIISSLTIFALFSLPGWLYDRLADSYTHLSTGFAIAGILVVTLITGVCYLLGACFVVHLMARAYWVGLIGLRTAFPEGIDWRRTHNLGPLTREHYRASLPTQAELIRRTDRFASSLFAVISMLTLFALWLGGLMLITAVTAGLVGARFGATNAALGLASLTLLAVFAGVPLIVYLLDAQLAARSRVLAESRFFAALVATLRRISAIAYPQRLILPVQLTLQSNTRPFLFYAVLVLAAFAIVAIGSYRVAAWRDFTVSSEFTFLGDEEINAGLRSTYYEDMPGGLDRMRPWPRISSFTQSGSHLRLFLPYHPLRDDIMLRRHCGDPRGEIDRVDCVRGLWSVSLAGREIPMEAFVPAQRADLAMRGLMGVVPLAGLEPGMQVLEVAWNPLDRGQVPADDRYESVSNDFTIPFLFAPAFERSLD